MRRSYRLAPKVLVAIPGEVLAVYMMGGGGGGGPTELNIANPKKYMSLKFYIQKKTWHQNFTSKKIQDLAPQY